MVDTLISAVLGALLGAFSTIGIVDKLKTKQKRKLLLNLLDIELRKFKDKSDRNQKPVPSLVSQMRPQLIWNILSAEILHPKKDKMLIEELHELVSWMESHNNFTSLNNLAVLFNPQPSDQLTQMAFHYGNKTFDQVQKVRGILQGLIKHS